MKLDSGMLAFNIELSAQTPPEAVTWPLDQQRAVWKEVCKKFSSARPAGLLVQDCETEGVKFRLYTPQSSTTKIGVLYFHGGGWVLGGPETHDDMCAEMAAGADCIVALVDYRLAPEHTHPAQLEDSLKVWRWMRENVSQNIVAAGDSAGGQMSAGLALHLKALGLPQLKGMVLIYPVLGVDIETPSYHRNANATGLTRADMIYYLTSFLGPEGNPNWRDEKAVPNLAQDVSGLPPTFITVAGHDPLHDDGIIFAKKLNAAGIACTVREEPDLAHSYMRARNISGPAKKGFDAIVEALKAF